MMVVSSAWLQITVLAISAQRAAAWTPSKFPSTSGPSLTLCDYGTRHLSLSSSSSSSEEAKNPPRHDVGGSPMDVPESVMKQMEAYKAHQDSAPKLDWATDVRTLVQYNHGFAVMSTFSKADPDYPGGSVVGFAPDPETGEPVFCFSGMSTHTQDLLANPACSLTVAAKDFKGAADGRVNIAGRCVLLKTDEERDAARELYLQKHPGAFWVNFGDFNWFRLTSLARIRFVGGFARAGSVTPEEYAAARPDVVSEFGPAIAKHMNEDHMSSTVAMVKAFVPSMMTDIDGVDGDDSDKDGIPEVTEAEITSVDSFGMYVKVTRSGAVPGFLPQQFKLRLPFSRPAVDRKDVRTLIVEMTQQAADILEKKDKKGETAKSTP